jgi:hypothetical protein
MVDMANTTWAYQGKCSAGFFKIYISNNYQRFGIKSPASLKVFAVNAKDRQYQVWQRNPLSVDVFSKEVYIQKMEYIHNNPVKAGLCNYPELYKYSLAKFYETGEDEFGIVTHWVA